MNPKPKVMDMIFWITERHAIKERREAGLKPPWTADSTMATVRFCNVHREDDKVTRWFRQNWNDMDDPAWVFVLGRMLNYIPTLETIVGMTSLVDISYELKRRRARGEKVFTSVYTISTCGKAMDKIDYVIDMVCADVAHAGEPDYESMQTAFENLTNIDGLGTFLAAQVLADMKNTVGHPLYNAPDKKTFVAPGPGSINGLSEFFNTNITRSNFKIMFDECRALVDPLIPKDIPHIDNQDFQNCLCEFSKYIRVREGGHARNHYDPYRSSV